MDNYYELLEIEPSATNREIKRAYRKKVVKFNNNYTSENDNKMVKKLKKGLYILLDENLRKLYNKKLFTKNKKKNETFQPINHFQNNSVNNNEFLITNNNLDKNNDFRNKQIHDRIFNLSTLHNIPQKNIDYENQILKNLKKNSQQNV
jgi:curved DNA-binding protein CbpA